MPLNLNPRSDKDFVPYLKYNAKAGRWYARFDGQSADVEVQTPRLVYDFQNIKVGWIAFAASGPPQFAWDADSATAGPRPDWPKVKRGFCVHVVGRDKVPAAQNQTLGVRELMSTASAIIEPLLAMYAQWEEHRASKPTELPVFHCTGVKAVVGKNGTNYIPVFNLLTWVERDMVKELDGAPMRDNAGAFGTSGHEDSEQPPPFTDDDIPF